MTGMLPLTSTSLTLSALYLIMKVSVSTPLLPPPAPPQ